MRKDGADIRDIREMCVYRDGLPRNCPNVLEEGDEDKFCMRFTNEQMKGLASK